MHLIYFDAHSVNIKACYMSNEIIILHLVTHYPYYIYNAGVFSYKRYKSHQKYQLVYVA